MGRRSTTGFRRARRGLIAGATAVLAVPTFLVATPTIARAATSGLQQSSTTTYTVDPAANAVHVRVDVTVTNTVPDRHTSRGVEQTYYRGISVVVLAEATNFHAVSASGSTLSVTAQPASVPIAQDLEIHIPNLFYQHTQHALLDYDLPNGAPRSKSLTRVTPAFATFSAWPGSGGDASVVIVVPKAFDVDLVGDPMNEQSAGATVTYTANQIAHPEQWFVTISARDDTKLVNHELTVGGQRFGIRALPDDPGWASFVASQVRKGAPALQKLVGLKWPPAGLPLEITETVTPYLYGYAGWYSANDNTIEIGDALDPQVVLHEISHTWFNSHLLDERWIDEGLAQEFAARAVAATGGTLESPKPVNPSAPGAVRLESWTNVDLKAQNSEAREAFGYNASWYVIRQVTNDIGVAGMQRVLAAANAHALPYLGDKNVPEANPPTGNAGSWKRLLDYLDQTGGAHDADALFEKYVALPGDKTIAERAAARQKYVKFLLATAGLAPPLVVRQAMTSWDFDTATELMPKAQQASDTIRAIGEIASPLGLTVPKLLQQDYAYQQAVIGTVQLEANKDLAAVKALRSASHAVDGHHGVLAKIGLIGANHKSRLHAARDAFASGDPAAATAAALAASKTVHDASTAGLLRLVLALVAILVLVFLVVTVRRWRRRRAARRRDGDPAGPDPASGNGEVAAGVAG